MTTSRQQQMKMLIGRQSLIRAAIAFICLAMTCFPTVVHSQEAEKSTTDIEREIKAKIAQELESGTVPSWAGNYLQGNQAEFNVNLDLTPKAGFVYHLSSRAQFDHNYGGATEVDGRVQLTCVLPLEKDPPTPVIYIPVSWEQRKYLIPVGEMLSFCNAFNSGWLTRHSYAFLVERTHAESSVSGKPQVPEDFRTYLLDRPLNCNLTEIALPELRTEVRPDSAKGYERIEWFRTTLLTIDKGRNDPVFVGMELFPTSDGISITVTQVDELSSKAVLTEWVGVDVTFQGKSIRNGFQAAEPLVNKKSTESIVPKIGDKYSTKYH